MGRQVVTSHKALIKVSKGEFMKAFKELDQVVDGLDRIDEMADRTLIAMQGNTAVVTKVPVVLMDEIGHSCRDPKNCKLNTTDHPYWCMIANDRAHERAE